MDLRNNRAHIQHSRRHFGFSYPRSLTQWLYTILSPFILLLVLFLALRFFSFLPGVSASPFALAYFGKATLATLLRLSIAYCFALILSLPLALLVEYNAFAERILLPVFDIIQSVPTLAFFPVIALSFIRLNFVDGAAILIIFLGMLWNIVFSLVGGLKIIPSDIKAAARVFNLRGIAFARRVLLPASIPYLVTGSLLAWAQGWNIIIVAEVLHTYLPGGTSSQDLFGIGSVLVNAAGKGESGMFVGAILTITATIAIINFFVWQNLLRYAERYKFE